MATRSLKPVDQMAATLKADKNRDGYKTKLYSSDRKADALANLIGTKLNDLTIIESQSRVDWNNLGQVQERTRKYLTACQAAEVFPSVMGLATLGFGYTRQGLNQYLRDHPNTPTAQFIELVKDLISDILSNSSLHGNANPIQTIFTLKNMHGWVDTVTLDTVHNNPLGELMDPAEIMKRLEGLEEY